MSNSSFDSNYNKNSNKKNHTAIKVAAGFIACIVAVAITSIAVSSMLESLDEVSPSSKAEFDSLKANIIPEKIPDLAEGIDETKESVSHLSGIFSNFIKNP